MFSQTIFKCCCFDNECVFKQNKNTYPSIAQFYAGKTVALTGGTGFLGQGIIEKLLYSCPEVKKIIVLIRNKRGVTPEDRLKSLANKPVSTTF